ncbi:MAG TPA: radical SAM protein [Polyangia bacterium]
MTTDRGVEAAVRVDHVPNLDLNIGRRCNLRCVFCVDGDATPEQRRWVPLDKAQRELTLGYEQGCRSLALLGGEATIYPHVLPVLELATRLGYRQISIVTNGTRLADPALVDRLIAGGVTRCAISIHSHRADLEDWITGVPGSLERKLAGIRHLIVRLADRRMPGNVSLNPVLCTANIPHMVEMMWAFAALGVDDLRFNFIHPTGRALGSRLLSPPVRVAGHHALRAIEENERRLRLRLTFSDLPLCAWPRDFLTDADLVRRYLGEPHDRRTRAAVWSAPLEQDEKLERFSWVEHRQNHLKAKVAACRDCRLEDRCEGVWRQHLAIHGDGDLSPP